MKEIYNGNTNFIGRREMGDDEGDIRAEQASRYWLYYANGSGEDE